jgi:hypothetical protein
MGMEGSHRLLFPRIATRSVTVESNEADMLHLHFPDKKR